MGQMSIESHRGGSLKMTNRFAVTEEDRTQIEERTER